jgi:acetyl-CoA carboxylase carboxyl transferase subunit alpha
MLENATLSVISPEGFASIYWKDPLRAKEASEIMKMTANELLELGVVDTIIPEDVNGLQNDKEYSFEAISISLKGILRELMSVPAEKLVEERRCKLRDII